MTDFTINNVQVTDRSDFDANSQPIVTKRVTFYVGKNGPFILSYKPSEYSSEKVLTDMKAQVATLEAIHAGIA
jgi:hypothetical protein